MKVGDLVRRNEIEPLHATEPRRDWVGLVVDCRRDFWDVIGQTMWIILFKNGTHLCCDYVYEVINESG